MFEENNTLIKELAPMGEDLPVPKQLLHLNTTTVNQLLGLPGLFSTFVAKDLRNLRILALTASSASIVACVASIFFLINIDRRKRVFRHDLVFFLIICDLVKALVLMIYPLVILLRNDVYADARFFNTLGWFTAYCVEGADMAIFFFAIHFALLIFLPSWRWRRQGSGRVEGGLYGVRKYIWPITALVPVLLASLAFINFELLDQEQLREGTTVVLDNDTFHFSYDAHMGGYKPYSAWCYLPPYPVWYKLVLSWGPRYFIIVFILVLYISIYVFVRRQSKRIKSHLFDFRGQRTKQVNEPQILSKWQLVRSKVFRYLIKPILHCLLNLKNFLFFNFEESSVSTSGRTSITSAGSFYATDEGASFDQVPDIGAIHDHSVLSRRELDALGSGINHSKTRLNVDDDSYVGNGSSQVSENHNIISGNIKENEDKESNNDLDGHTPRLAERLETEKPEAELAANNSHPISRTVLSPIRSLYVQESQANERGGLENIPQNNDDGPHRTSTTDVKNVQANFQKQTYAAMKRRRAQIQKNLRSIFIYPFSYIGIWIFPLVVDATQYHYEIMNGPVVWLVYIATIAQPLNGLVDTLVFVYREKPWNCSWAKIQFQELLDAYSLKDGMGENDIKELYYSELGKKGWYFCGRFDRLGCWKHKPQRWKRAAWYFNRFLNGFWRNDYNFEDHCNALPTDYNCDSQETSTCFNLNKLRCEQRERQFSFPSDSTTGSGPAESRKGSDSIDYVRVSTFWSFVHLLPMLGGVDLDELDRQIRRKSMDHDFVLPGLQLALNKGGENGQDLAKTKSKPLFKPEYSVSNEKRPASGTRDRTAAHAQPGLAQMCLSADEDFSDVVKKDSSKATGEASARHGDGGQDEMGMLAFLKGPVN